MKFSNDNRRFKIPPEQTSQSTKSPTTITNMYTLLKILKQIKQNLGLEALIEYIDCNLLIIENCNPKLKMAVTTALKQVNVERIYYDAINKNAKEGP